MKSPARPKKAKRKRSSSRASKVSRSPQATPDRRPRLGLEAAVEKIVPPEWTLAAFDSRLPAVFATPAMIGMMEMAAASAVLPELAPGEITVGTRIEVDHLKAVPAGTLVRATARLVEYTGRSARFLAFEVEAKAGEHVIGRGRVYRAIVEPAKFNSQAHERKS
jgi:fluoroacetyl-CoA thioesterase